MGLTRINNQALPTLDSDKLPSGSVLQVKSSEIVTGNNGLNSHTTSTATGEVDCGASLSFTPKSSSSKLYITATLLGQNSSGNAWFSFGIHHDGNFLVKSGQQTRDSNEEESITLMASVDSGNTNARTIKLRQYTADAGSKSFKSQSIKVIEVAG